MIFVNDWINFYMQSLMTGMITQHHEHGNICTCLGGLITPVCIWHSFVCPINSAVFTTYCNYYKKGIVGHTTLPQLPPHSAPHPPRIHHCICHHHHHIYIIRILSSWLAGASHNQSHLVRVGLLSAGPAYSTPPPSRKAWLLAQTTTLYGRTSKGSSSGLHTDPCPSGSYGPRGSTGLTLKCPFFLYWGPPTSPTLTPVAAKAGLSPSQCLSSLLRHISRASILIVLSNLDWWMVSSLVFSPHLSGNTLCWNLLKNIFSSLTCHWKT